MPFLCLYEAQCVITVRVQPFLPFRKNVHRDVVERFRCEPLWVDLVRDYTQDRSPQRDTLLKVPTQSLIYTGKHGGLGVVEQPTIIARLDGRHLLRRHEPFVTVRAFVQVLQSSCPGAY